jgi:Tol biopolymer transport system component
MLANVNSDSSDREPVLSADGLTLFFASDRTPAPSDGGGLDIYVATRPNILSDFGAPGSLAGVNTAAREDPVSLSPDGKFLYFSSGSPTYAKSLTTGDPPTPLTELNPVFWAPIMTGNGLTTYLGSYRAAPNPDAGDLNDVNIWSAHRVTASSPLTDFAPVEELNSDGLDSPLWVSPDGCALYFTSDRNNPSLNYDIWVARKPDQ